MKLIILFFSVLFLSGSALAEVDKKIKLKGNKHVSFHYHKDSTDLPKKEIAALLQSFVTFYDVVNDSNYTGYLEMLSTTTLKRIKPMKLERKFQKFRKYAVFLKGKIQIRSIRKFEKKGSDLEESTMYVCILKLPEGQQIPKRVGFDPLKRMKFDAVEDYVGLHFVKDPSGYRMVILF